MKTMHFSSRRTQTRGFTLLELLVVILIIGLLTGIIAPRLIGQISRSEVTVARAQMESLDKALQSYRIDMGRYPTTSEGLQALVVAPAELSNRWNGPYLKGGVPADPWGTAYQYTLVSGADEFTLSSFGRDRVAGGNNDDADLLAH